MEPQSRPITPQNLPTGIGRHATAIRNLDRRVARLEPMPAPGTLTTTHPAGSNAKPLSPMRPNRTRASNSTPRYR